MKHERSDETGAWVRSAIEEFVSNSPENTLRNQADDKAFDGVLVGFSSGEDPMYEELKSHVGPFHWTPLEIFQKTFPGVHPEPGGLTVVSYVLPHNPLTKSDNRRESRYPSERWARARIYGEAMNAKLRNHAAEIFAQKGIRAVAPASSPLFERKTSDRFGFASTWSERHVAHISGLGTFGLCDGLITARGKAHRLGSVVAEFRTTATPRPYAGRHSYCLFLSKGICGKCIGRCPAGALSETGHDKAKCREYMRPRTDEYVKARYGFDGYGCGLCQTGVPCESRIPVAEGAQQVTRDT